MSEDSNPQVQINHDEAEQRRHVKRDLRGAGWSMLINELITTVGGILLLFFFVLKSQTFAQLVRMFGWNMADVTLVWVTILTALIGVIPFYIYGCNRSVSLGDKRNLGGYEAKDIVLLTLAVLGVNFVGGFVVQLIDLLFNAVGFTIIVDTSYGDTALSYWLMTIYAVLLAPLIEEFIYRGMLLGGLRRYGDRFAVVVSAAVFGLTHGNLMQLLPAAMIGLLLGYIRVKTDSWSLCVLLHAFNNVIARLLEALSSAAGGTAYQLTEGALVLVVIVVAIVVLKRLKARYGKLEQPQNSVKYRLLINIPSVIWLIGVVTLMIVSISTL